MTEGTYALYINFIYSETSDSGPSEKGTHCQYKTSLQGTLLEVQKHWLPYCFNSYSDNLQEEDNLSTKDKTSESIILSPTYPLFGGSTV